MLFDGFRTGDAMTAAGPIRYVVGGSGPPMLLLHGHPQTHAMWHRVAPLLARHFTVVASDLRGYGDSAKPASDATHLAYSKRAMAQDQVELMAGLGFDRFALVGHDRGGRVGHRLCLDHPGRVSTFAALDIVPTRAMYQQISLAWARPYYHWFFLIQPFDLPERMIQADPDFYLAWHMEKRQRTKAGIFDPEAMAEYRRCYRLPGTIHAICEDYRAAASIDLEHDEADLDRRIDCPMLALWGAAGVVAEHFDPIAEWRKRARDVSGRAIDAGHYLAEEAPEETAEALAAFVAAPEAA
ncbi:alpha/beta fold hydrolase [Stella sp.]|uniref:alpha/beta fold hydrolase n=1 Tax=Stella sp. TaxID=2912054 RepID=UPI0035B3C1D1